MSDQIDLYRAQRDLDHAESRFNALAQVVGRNMPQYLDRRVTVPVTIMLAAGSAAGQARFDDPTKQSRRGTLVAAGLGVAAWIFGFMVEDNADMREAAFTASTALAGSAASVFTYDMTTIKLASQTAPPAAAPAAAA